MGLMQALAAEAEQAAALQADYRKLVHLIAELKSGNVELDQVKVDLLNERVSWDLSEQTNRLNGRLTEKLDG